MKPLKIIRKAAHLLASLKFKFFPYVLHKMGLYSMPDDEFLRCLYKLSMGRDLDLQNPKTFTEKLQWLKLYDRRPEYTRMADKYAVKKLVADKIGSEYVIPLLGVWDKFEDIDFDALPEQFVLKCTHDSGGLVICRDKAAFDREAARKVLSSSLLRNYYPNFREWVYKDITPRIIAENYIPSLGRPESVEYKLTCFNGVAKLITICRGIAHSSFDVRTNDHYDRDMNRLHFWVNYKNPEVPENIPEQMPEIIALSEKLSTGIPEVRVDWYIDKGKIYFGEFTFYTWAGFMHFNPPEYDEILGSWLELSSEKHC